MMKQINEDKKSLFNKNSAKKPDEEHTSLPNVLKVKSRANKEIIVLHKLNCTAQNLNQEEPVNPYEQ